MCYEDGVKLATLACCGKRACASCLGRLKEQDWKCYWCRQHVPERSLRAALNGVEVWPPPRPKSAVRKTDEQRRVEPPRERDADGMDQELAAALGIQISDERTQEANVLGARLATGVSAPPLALAFLPLAVVLYVDAELSARLPLTSNEMDGGSLLMRCAFGACIPFFLLVAVGANVVNGVKRLVRRPPPSE